MGHFYFIIHNPAAVDGEGRAAQVVGEQEEEGAALAQGHPLAADVVVLGDGAGLGRRAGRQGGQAGGGAGAACALAAIA